MPANSKSPALPTIEIYQDGKRYKVDWDYQEAPESDALVAQQDFIEGYILGVIDALGIPRESITSFRAETGTVRNLSQDTASRLAELIAPQLRSVVTEAHRRLFTRANPPHVLLNHAHEQDRDLNPPDVRL